MGEPRRTRNVRSALRVLASYAVLGSLSLIALFPVLQIVTISLRPADRLLSTSLEVIPKNGFACELSQRSLRNGPSSSGLANSTFVALVGQQRGRSGSTCGYAFSRFSFAGKKNRPARAYSSRRCSGDDAPAADVHHAVMASTLSTRIWGS